MASLAISPWLSTQEYLAISGMSLRTFRRKQATIETRKEGNRLLIASSSLPADALAKLEALSTPRTEVMRPAEPACAPAPLFAAAAQGPGRRIVLTDEQQAQAEQRLRILRPLLDFSKDAATRARCQFALTFRTKDGGSQRVRTVHDMAEYLAQQHASSEKGLSKQTILRWKGLYEKDGLSGLVRKQRSNKGRCLWAERWPEAAKLAAAAYWTPSQSKQIAYDTLRLNAPRLGIREAEMPSYAAVCDYLSSLAAPATIWAREGERALHERTMPYLSRKYTDRAPNDVWVADTMLHDVLVPNDCFGDRDLALVRLQLTAIADLRSRKFVGYSWCLNGSSRSITSALIMAVRRYGPPVEFYCDNGHDYQKVARGARPAYKRPENWAALVEEEEQELSRLGALHQLGISARFCIPFRPQSKPIERTFGTLHGRLDAMFRGYTTGNAYTKPDATVAAVERHRKLTLVGREQESPLVPASQFVAMAQTWIEQDYNAGHHHRGKGMDLHTPDEIFATALESRRPFDQEVLDQLLWQRETRTVIKCAVTVGRTRYVAPNGFAGQQMFLANGSEVTVCLDPHAPETAIACRADGTKLCDLQAERLVAHGDSAGPAIQASMKAARGMRKAIVTGVRQVRAEVDAAGYKTLLQDLHERSLPMAVGAENLTQPAPRRQASITSAPVTPRDAAARAFAIARQAQSTQEPV